MPFYISFFIFFFWLIYLRRQNRSYSYDLILSYSIFIFYSFFKDLHMFWNIFVYYFFMNCGRNHKLLLFSFRTKDIYSFYDIYKNLMEFHISIFIKRERDEKRLFLDNSRAIVFYYNIQTYSWYFASIKYSQLIFHTFCYIWQSICSYLFFSHLFLQWNLFFFAIGLFQ